MHVTPYLNFDGRAEEAIEFYKKAVGAQVGMLMRFKDAPPGSSSPESADKVMHAAITIGHSTVMLSDGYNKNHPKFEGISLSLNADNEAHAQELFYALGEGGKAEMPLAQTFFAKRFGMVADKFGVMWMIITE